LPDPHRDTQQEPVRERRPYRPSQADNVIETANLNLACQCPSSTSKPVYMTVHDSAVGPACRAGPFPASSQVPLGKRDLPCCVNMDADSGTEEPVVFSSPASGYGFL